jgi:hypothetical protein
LTFLVPFKHDAATATGSWVKNRLPSVRLQNKGGQEMGITVGNSKKKLEKREKMAFLGDEKSANRLWPFASAFVSKNYAESEKNWPQFRQPSAKLCLFKVFINLDVFACIFIFTFYYPPGKQKALFKRKEERMIASFYPHKCRQEGTAKKI